MSTAGLIFMMLPGRTNARWSASRRPRCSPTRAAAARTAARGCSRPSLREIMVDIGAREMGMDPLESRRRNVVADRRAAVHERRPACRLDVVIAGGDARAGRRDHRLRRSSAPSRRPRRRGRPAARHRHRRSTSSRHRRWSRLNGHRDRDACASTRRHRSRSRSGRQRTARASRRRCRRSWPRSSASTSTTSCSSQGDTGAAPFGRRHRRQPERGDRRRRRAQRVAADAREDLRDRRALMEAAPEDLEMVDGRRGAGNADQDDDAGRDRRHRLHRDAACCRRAWSRGSRRRRASRRRRSDVVERVPHRARSRSTRHRAHDPALRRRARTAA